MRRSIFLLLGLVLTLCLGLPGCGGSESTAPGGDGADTSAPEGNALPVTLVIASDAGDRTFADIPWSPGMTVKGMMDAAEDEDGKLSYDHSGRGETAILSAIGGVENEGGGRDAKNWLYWIGDAFATRGFAVAEVDPGETVTWRFAPYDAADE